jgi:dephospho-CoA kinase
MTDNTDKFGAKDFLSELDSIMTEQAANNRYVARLHDYIARGVKHLPLLRLGLTGGFASGKSTVAGIFEALGCPVVSADAIVHDLLAHDATIINDIRYAFGDGVFNGDTIDRRKLAQRIFTNADERRTLEAILHPRVGDIIKREAERLEQEGHTLACFEIPLLYEAHWEDWCDSVMVVSCDEATQVTRAMQKFSISRDDAIARIHAQLPLDDKKNRADIVIDNTGPLESLKPQIEAIYNRLLPQG